MIILAHRGYWKDKNEKNTYNALTRAIKSGFGFESDIRDCNGELVISHDIPNIQSLNWCRILEEYDRNNSQLWMALNIKCDGIGDMVSKTLMERNIKNYFFFDMSNPELYLYYQKGYPFFSRQSDFERFPLFYQSCLGIWMDEFDREWITTEEIMAHLNNNKMVALVSPELHGKSYMDKWTSYKELINNIGADDSKRVLLCTDYPEKARKFFNE